MNQRLLDLMNFIFKRIRFRYYFVKIQMAMGCFCNVNVPEYVSWEPYTSEYNNGSIHSDDGVMVSIAPTVAL